MLRGRGNASEVASDGVAMPKTMSANTPCFTGPYPASDTTPPSMVWYQGDSVRVNQSRCFAVVVALLFGLVPGCTGVEPATPGIVVAFDGEPQSLDPRIGLDANASRVADLLH